MEVKASVVENVFGQWFACYTSESIGPFDTKEKAKAALLNQGAVSNEPPTRPAVPCLCYKCLEHKEGTCDFIKWHGCKNYVSTES